MRGFQQAVAKPRLSHEVEDGEAEALMHAAGLLKKFSSDAAGEHQLSRAW